MRTAFVETLSELAEKDPRITLVVNDLGFGVVLDFARRFPRQFLNIGVAEQNMAGIGAGLALSGKIVFTYSIANFPTLRCLEQLRNDVCYSNANLISVAVGGGLAYGALGMTHHATEDIAILRALPHMKVVAPGDPLETVAATRAVAAGVGPVYLRLGRAGDPVVHRSAIEWSLGKAIRVREGNDLTLIATGGMLHTAVSVAQGLAGEGFSARVLSMHTVKPIDKNEILAAARDTHFVITLEEHSILGGLGGATAEILAEADLPSYRFRRIGLPSTFERLVGDQDYLRQIYGLDTDSIVDRILHWLQKA